MLKSSFRAVLALKEAIRPEQLPVQVPRQLAAIFASCHRMTLIRAERDGDLVPIRRGASRNVYYDRSNLLRWMGLDPRESIKRSAGRRANTRREDPEDPQ